MGSVIMNKPEELKKLADLINGLTDEHFNMSDEYPEDDFTYHYAKSSDTISEIEELANGCLIKKGNPDFDAMRQLKQLCPRIVRIHRGDGDSWFGWLTGVIVLENSKAIVYG